ncbi:hypothetical protein D3C80_1260460 [compost metagenome]
MPAAQLLSEQAISPLQGIGFDIDHLGDQSGQGQGGLANLYVFLAAGCQKHFDPLRIALRRTLHLEVDRHFLKRIGNVLIGFDLQLVLEVIIGKTGIHFDGLGDHRGASDSDRYGFHSGLGFGQQARKGLPDALKLGNVFLDHRIWRERLDSVSLYLVAAS